MPRHVYRVPCIREVREAHGLTVEKLAGMAGITMGHLSKVERGISAPSVPVTMRIANALGVRPSDLFLPDASRAPVERTASAEWMARVLESSEIPDGRPEAAGDGSSLSDEDIERIARRVAELLQYRWEVIEKPRPPIAESIP